MSVNTNHDEHSLQERIERIANLPTPAPLAAMLLKALADPDLSPEALSRIVSHDVAVCAKIMRLANSEYCGSPRSITNLLQAVELLGYKVIRTLVVSLTVFDALPSPDDPVGRYRIGIWRHSLRCGLVARMLAEQLGRSVCDPHDAFCAGLLHDIGKIVMDHYLHDRFTATLQAASDKGVPFCKAEGHHALPDHTRLASWLVKGWELPDSVQLPAIHHHHPEQSGGALMTVRLVHFADYLTYTLKLNDPQSCGSPPLCDDSVHALQADRSLHAVIAREFPGRLAATALFAPLC